MGVSRAVAALAGLAGVRAADDMSVSLRLLASNGTTTTSNSTVVTVAPTDDAPIQIDLAVETKFSLDIGNMTKGDFVSQMSSTKEWKDSTTDSLFEMLKVSLGGLKKSEIKNVAAVLKSRRLAARNARKLAATEIKYDTKFSVVPDFSGAAAPAYMVAFNASGGANAGMSVVDKLVNEISAVVTKSVTDGGFATGVVAALKAAAANNSAFQAALTAAGADGSAIAAMTAAAVTVSAPVVTNAMTGVVQTTNANYATNAPMTTAAPTTSNAAAAGVAAVVASALMMF